MGILVPSTPLEDLSSPLATHQIQTLVNTLQGLEPGDLRLFLSEMFNSMSMPAKEATVEVMWETLNPRERLLFDLPRESGPRGHRHPWTREEVLRGLATPSLRSRRVDQSHASGGRLRRLSERMNRGSLANAEYEINREIESQVKLWNSKWCAMLIKYFVYCTKIFDVLANAIARAEQSTATSVFNQGSTS
jgi:hypothetical protein